MKKVDYNGDWYLPNCLKSPGVVHVDPEEGHIFLDVFSSCALEGPTIKFPSEVPIYFQPFILGVGPGGPFTLYNCKLEYCRSSGVDFYCLRYRVEYLIIGIALSIDNDLKVRSGKFTFPYLAEWYEGWQHANHLENLTGSLKEINSVTTEILRINDQLELVFTDEVRSYVKEFNFTYEISYNKFLEFTYESPVLFSKLLEDSLTFQKLLEFSYRKPLNRKLTSLVIDNAFPKGQDVEMQERFGPIRYYVHNFSLTKNKGIEKFGSHAVHTLLSNPKLSKKGLNEIIANWFCNKNLNNIIEYFIDSDNWFQDYEDVVLTNVMFNNRFLNLIQGLEDCYRELLVRSKSIDDTTIFNQKKAAILKDVADPILKQWLNNEFKRPKNTNLKDKLATILIKCTPTLNSFCGPVSFDSFPTSASKARNDLSHGLKKNIDMGESLHLDYHVAQLLLLICILETLEVPDIKKLLSNNFKVQRTMQEIRHLQQKYVP